MKKIRTFMFLTVLLFSLIAGNTMVWGSATLESEASETPEPVEQTDNPIHFKTDTVTWQVNVKNPVIAKQTVVCEKEDGHGKITYSLEAKKKSAADSGISIDADSGTVTVTSFKKLCETLSDQEGSLTLLVRAVMEENETYKKAEATYEIKISFMELPDLSCVLLKTDGSKAALTEDNHGFYPYDVKAVPSVKNGRIALSEPEDFKDEVSFSKEGETTQTIWLTDAKGNLKAPETRTIKIDKTPVAAEAIRLSYNPSGKKDNCLYFDQHMHITFAATDTVSGIDHFLYRFCDGDTIIAEGKLPAKADKSKAGLYRATLYMPEEEVREMEGSLLAAAVDGAGNVSAFKEDEPRLIYDITAPEGSIRAVLEESNRTLKDEKETGYEAKRAVVALHVHEKNFSPEDMKVTLKTEGKSDETLKVSWQAAGEEDTYTAKVTLEKEGVHKILLSGCDLASNELKEVTSGSIVIDKTLPVLSEAYTYTGNKKGETIYSRSSITVTFTIKETYFDPEATIVEVSENGAFFKVKQVTWTKKEKDLYTCACVISPHSDHRTDGSYLFRVRSADLSGNSMKTFISKKLVLDSKAPVISIQYTEYDHKKRIAKVRVQETNFSADAIRREITAKDVSGKDISLKNKPVMSAFTYAGDTYGQTITFSENAVYTLRVYGEDLAGNQAKAAGPDAFIIDAKVPENLKITYSTSILDTILNGITFGYYKEPVTVTVTASDQISGVKKITCYLKKDGKKEEKSSEAGETQLKYTNGGRQAKAVFKIPSEKNGQFKGSVLVTVEDRSGNVTEKFPGEKKLIVDSDAPELSVDLTSPAATYGEVKYYAGDIVAFIKIRETNFYAEDVETTVTKNGKKSRVSLSFTDSKDTHTAKLTLCDEGTYTIHVSYKDRSGNQMDTYTSEKMVIDTTMEAPDIRMNQKEADQKTFSGEAGLTVTFYDANFLSYNISMKKRNVDGTMTDVTDMLDRSKIRQTKTGVTAAWSPFKKEKNMDGIYRLTLKTADRAGHNKTAEAEFTINRFGSSFYPGNYLSYVSSGDDFIKKIEEDLVITEINPDPVASRKIFLTKDGRPVANFKYMIEEETREKEDEKLCRIYTCTFKKENFSSDGLYKLYMSSVDEAGNTSVYPDTVTFCVDTTCPDVELIKGLENPIVNGEKQPVSYVISDTRGLAKIEVYLDERPVDTITDFSGDSNRFEGTFSIPESKKQQKVTIIAEDLAGNRVSTSDADFRQNCPYVFYENITVSTNRFVRLTARLKNAGVTYGWILLCAAGVICMIAAALAYRKTAQSLKK